MYLISLKCHSIVVKNVGQLGTICTYTHTYIYTHTHELQGLSAGYLANTQQM